MRLKFQCNKEILPIDLAMMIVALKEAQENKEPIYFAQSTELVIGEKVPSKAKRDPALRMSIAKDVISYLNKQTGKRYSAKAKATITLINGRISDGATLEDFKIVIDNKCQAWRGDPRMDQYLRPETLFSAKHFESYLNEKSARDLDNDAFSGLDSALESVK